MGGSVTAVKPRGLSFILLATVVAMVLGLGMGMLQSRPAGATTSWTAIVPPVPSNFTSLIGESANSIACPSAGNCVAVGSYDPPAATYALLETETNGVWSSVTPPLPADALLTGQHDVLSYVSCSSVGNCVAVGYYNLAADFQNYQPLLLVETNGTWADASTTFPADAIAGSEYQLNGVSCPSDNNCTAVGTYANAVGTEALIINEVNGVWTAVNPTPLPAGAGPSGAFGESLFNVSCASPGNCAAVGYYYDQSLSAYGLLLDTSVNGTWTNQVVTLPGDAVPGYDYELYAVSCPVAGACVAGGNYDTTDGMTALVASQSGSTWTTSAAPLPSDAINDNTPGSTIKAVHCVAAGSCTVVGSYETASQITLPLIDVFSGGTWSNVIAPTPSDMVPNVDNQYYDVSCSTATNCLAIGGYYNSSGELPMLGVETNGVWSQQPVTLPAGSGPAPGGLEGSELYAATCTQQGECQMFGYSYQTTQGQNYPIVASGNIVGIATPPTAVVAVAGDGQATISWSAPTNTGSSPITGYTASAVEAANDPICTTTSATSCVITGLTNTKTYSVTVTATNAAGTSAPSVAITVTPHAVLAATGFNAQQATTASFVMLVIGGGMTALAWTRRRPHFVRS